MHKSLQEFLDGNKLINIATTSKEHGVWIYNAYFGNTDKAIFFVSNKDTNHVANIKADHRVAFSLAEFNNKDMSDRVGVQGLGLCQLVTNPRDIVIGLKSIYKKFPDWKDWIDEKNVFTNAYNSRLFKISIKYIKYWNDKEFGEDQFREFNFN